MNNGKRALVKSRTGIDGLDEITYGGLPHGRTTLVCGSAGSGKTVLGMEFLIHGALKFGEPGVFMAFEETDHELVDNIASTGYDLQALQKENKLCIDHVRIERSEIEETGDYDLEGLFIRLGCAVDSIGAKRVVLDTIEVLFSGLQDHGIIRAELRRLFRWLKDRGITAVITGERGQGELTRYGLEEYVADCVILLDHRITDQISTRRLRIVKYRGSVHGTDEYPFLIDGTGISVLPLTSLGLSHRASTERIPTGIAELDAMLCGEGFFRGSSILLSGTAGVGKSSIAMTFLSAACQRGESALYFGFEESVEQIVRNMRSIGLDLMPMIEQGLLHFHTVRPSSLGLESHLSHMHRLIREVQPRVVAIDPITNFVSVSDPAGVKSMLTRLVDFLKTEQITALFTHLAANASRTENTDQNISSIMDAWVLLRDLERGDCRTGALSVLKSRGMAHSRETRELVLTDAGVKIGGAHPKRPQVRRL
jgi:circadian clock protein KaiC